MGVDEIAAEQKGEGLPHANIYAPGYLTNYPKFAFNYKNYANKKDKDKVFLLTPFEAYWYLNQRGFPYKRGNSEFATPMLDSIIVLAK
ncbi:hypothetical protein ACSW8S_17270 (plasmid) [Clostridium perfringens]